MTGRWSWKVGRIAGIALRIHATFLLLFVWIVVSQLAAGRDAVAIGRGVALVASVFAIVVLHELGHALVARRFGVATRDITLYPIGGMARLEGMPKRPREELLVALAGPLVNFALAAVLLGVPRSAFVEQMIWINISLGVFNLIPAFPMDGGRVLRAVLAIWLDRPRATAVAASVGRVFAVVFGIAGLLWNPLLALIAVFIWLTAGQEAAVEKLKSSLHGLRVRDAMVSELRTIEPETPIGSAAEMLARGFQHAFPVVAADGRVAGMLARADALRGVALYGRQAPVADVMQRTFPIAGVDEELATVLERLTDGGAVVVMHDDRLVGLLDPAQLGDVLAARAVTPPEREARPRTRRFRSAHRTYP